MRFCQQYLLSNSSCLSNILNNENTITKQNIYSHIFEKLCVLVARLLVTGHWQFLLPLSNELFLKDWNLHLEVVRIKASVWYLGNAVGELWL